MTGTPASRKLVAHLTSVHPLGDVRINLHECQSLARRGYSVLVVGVGRQGGIHPRGVNYRFVRSSGSRWGRMTLTVLGVLRAARETGAAVFHIHDPELLTIVPFLKRGGSQVIYDAHEDLPRQILSKSWIPAMIRPAVSRIVNSWLPIVAGRADAVVAATDEVAHTFLRNRLVVTLANVPSLAEFSDVRAVKFTDRPALVTYVGAVTPARGIDNMVKAMAFVSDPEVRLSIAGVASPPAYLESMQSDSGSQRVSFLGWLDRPEVRELLGASVAGLVVLPPAPQHAAGMPTKMFEYMAAGIPVIVSDFRSWASLVEESGAGIAVDPTNPEAIAGAIDWCVSNRDEAEAMGLRGRLAVRARFNWESEVEKLYNLYDELIGPPQGGEE